MDLENLVDFKALQSNDRNELSLHTQQRLSPAEITQLDTLMLRTTVYYPNQELSAETFTEFRETMKELVSEYGMSEVEAAVMAVRKRSEFFPHPAAVNKELELRADKERERDLAQRAADQARWMQEQEKIQHEKVMAAGGYCSMADVVGDFYAKQKAKAEAAAKAKAAGE